MSATGFLLDFEQRARVIGAHADHNRADFIFLRAQSLELRALPWGGRLRPMKSWSEIATYCGAVLLGASFLSALFAIGA
jgi:hypothetical protein